MVQVRRRKNEARRLTFLLSWLIAVLALFVMVSILDSSSANKPDQTRNGGIMSSFSVPMSESLSRNLHKCEYKAFSDMRPYEKTPIAKK